LWIVKTLCTLLARTSSKYSPFATKCSGQISSARLRKFATLPAYQGQGLGSHLLKVMLADCRRRGLQHFWCDARESAIGFYRRFGMSTQGERFYKETVPYFTMAIDLGESP